MGRKTAAAAPANPSWSRAVLIGLFIPRAIRRRRGARPTPLPHLLGMKNRPAILPVQIVNGSYFNPLDYQSRVNLHRLDPEPVDLMADGRCREVGPQRLEVFQGKENSNSPSSSGRTRDSHGDGVFSDRVPPGPVGPEAQIDPLFPVDPSPDREPGALSQPDRGKPSGRGVKDGRIEQDGGLGSPGSPARGAAWHGDRLALRRGPAPSVPGAGRGAVRSSRSSRNPGVGLQ